MEVECMYNVISSMLPRFLTDPRSRMMPRGQEGSPQREPFERIRLLLCITISQHQDTICARRGTILAKARQNRLSYSHCFTALFSKQILISISGQSKDKDFHQTVAKLPQYA